MRFVAGSFVVLRRGSGWHLGLLVGLVIVRVRMVDPENEFRMTFGCSWLDGWMRTGRLSSFDGAQDDTWLGVSGVKLFRKYEFTLSPALSQPGEGVFVANCRI